MEILLLIAISHVSYMEFCPESHTVSKAQHK